MQPVLRNGLWLAALAIVGAAAFAAGYWRGAGYGAGVASELHVRGEAAERIGDLRQALDALERGDAALSARLHQETVRSALITLGSFDVADPAVADICTESARRTLADASQYLAVHPLAADDALAGLARQGADFCR
jgi:hypothetical protein